MKYKIRASLLHLLISFVLVSCVLAFVFLVCYPDPYFKVMGIGKLLVVLAGVDVCLGPLITFVIFNPGKKWLKFDLALIAMMQLSALAYGSVTLFVGRPAYVVFDVNRFSLVSAYQIPETVLKKMNYPAIPMTGPKLVGARIPSDRAERKKYITSVLIEDHVDLPRLLQYHVPYETMAVDVKRSMWSLEKLLARQSPEKLGRVKSILDQAVARSGMHYDELAFVPMSERDSSLTVLVRRNDASVVTILPIDPYGN